MNRFNPSLAFAVALSCIAFSAGAFAQEKPTTQATDKAEARTGKSVKHVSRTKTQHKMYVGKNEVRNWRAIDTNHDNLIEPDEMEAYLKQKS